MNETPDHELLRLHREGSNAAFDEIVNRYERRVYAVALRMCGNPDDARDVAQDVFVNALRSLKRFREEAQLGTWFHRVAVNASLDLIRRRGKRQAQALDEITEQPSTEAGPDEHAVAAARAREVQRALAAISADHRAVLVLHDLQGLDYAEVAQALDVPVGTVKSRIHRARVEIAKRLGHLRETEPAEAPTPLRDDR